MPSGEASRLPAAVAPSDSSRIRTEGSASVACSAATTSVGVRDGASQTGVTRTAFA